MGSKQGSVADGGSSDDPTPTAKGTTIVDGETFNVFTNIGDPTAKLLIDTHITQTII